MNVLDQVAAAGIVIMSMIVKGVDVENVCNIELEM